ncbi:hypothetical protein [Lewinella sp. 4G2]|uniref:hypothetical protein n=1 Tax=Lewinella sp. 4G2 TaxID=1803372 RepID=UPI0007B4E8AC|nr:hypothetical protein [Lewinella sp. 4G2]OAV43551.1 hypothetical protein A3850_003145 [Lewinella sp. 4G2]
MTPTSLKTYLLALLYTVLLLPGATVDLPAQEATNGVFAPGRHAELREEVVFTPPEEQEEEVEEVEKDISTSNDWTFGDFKVSREIAYVMLGVLLLLLGILVYRILGDVELRKRIRGNEEEQDQIMIEEIEEEALVASGVSLSLQERAEKAGQFDIAVRLLYIQLLKDLQDNGLIKYRRDYSNRDYQRQMRGSELLGEFREVTVDYERYWYGKYSIDALSYRLVKRKFAALTNHIQQASTTTPPHA